MGPITEKNFTYEITRAAHSFDLINLCDDLMNYAEEDNISLEVRHPNKKHVTRYDLVDSRRQNTLYTRGLLINPNECYQHMTENIDSFCEPFNGEITKVESTSSRNNEHFISLVFSTEDSTDLVTERFLIWDELSYLGKFTLDKVAWLDRPAELRLTYEAINDTNRNKSNTENIKKIIRDYLPLEVQLSPAYNTALLFDKNNYEKVDFKYFKPLTTSLMTQPSGEIIPTITHEDIFNHAILQRNDIPTNTYDGIYAKLLRTIIQSDEAQSIVRGYRVRLNNTISTNRKSGIKVSNIMNLLSNNLLQNSHLNNIEQTIVLSYFKKLLLISDRFNINNTLAEQAA